jgi:hypothetical protein
MTQRVSDEHKAIYAKRRTALGRYGDPEEVAHITPESVPAGSLVPYRRRDPSRWRPDGAQRLMSWIFDSA